MRKIVLQDISGDDIIDSSEDDADMDVRNANGMRKSPFIELTEV
jgi:hypothetical protein